MSRSQTRLGSLFLVIVTHVDIDLTGCQAHKPDLVIVTHVDIDLTGCPDHKPDWVIVTHVDIDLTGCQDHKPDLVIVTHVDIDLTGCQDHKPDLVLCFWLLLYMLTYILLVVEITNQIGFLVFGYCYTC